MNLNDKEFLESMDIWKARQEAEIGNELMDKIAEAIAIKGEANSKLYYIRDYICKNSNPDQKKAIYEHKISKHSIIRKIKEIEHIVATQFDDIPNKEMVRQMLIDIPTFNVPKDEVDDYIIRNFLVV